MCLQVVEVLHEYGIKFIAMRCAGFDKVDVEKLNELDMKVGKPDLPIAHACVAAGGAAALIMLPAAAPDSHPILQQP